MVPALPRGSKVQRPSAFPWSGHQRSGRGLAQRLTIKAFSAITFKLHISSGPPRLYGGWGQRHCQPSKAPGTLHCLSLQVQKGTWQISPLLSPQTIPNLLKFKRGTSPKIQAFSSACKEERLLYPLQVRTCSRKKTAVNHQSGLGSHPSLAHLGTPSKLDPASLQGTLLTQEVRKNIGGRSGDSGSAKSNYTFSL